MKKSDFILASGSPRRCEMLKAHGYCFKVSAPKTKESTGGGSMSPKVVALKNSRLKAVAAIKKSPGLVVLSADTIVVLNKHILGKPRNKKDSLKMLLKLNNKTHSVITAYTILSARDPGHGGVKIKIVDEKAVESFVTFGDFSAAEYKYYVKTGEPKDKAGAYGIQGLGARFIKEVIGSYTNIVGLPLFEVMRGLKKAGIKPRWR
ncbi:MAG: Maf family protein [Pseudomonadota bacterium]